MFHAFFSSLKETWNKWAEPCSLKCVTPEHFRARTRKHLKVIRSPCEKYPARNPHLHWERCIMSILNNCIPDPTRRKVGAMQPAHTNWSPIGCQSLAVFLLPRSRCYKVFTERWATLLSMADTFNIMLGTVNNCEATDDLTFVRNS